MTLSSETIKAAAHELGFSLCGVAPARPVEARFAQALRRYLARGDQGGMAYLERNLDKRLDAARLVEGGRSVICTAVCYYHDRPPARAHAVARYARFGDYHRLLKARLKRLAGVIRQRARGAVVTRCFVDTAPLLEKYYAWQAGLGWIGKHSLLVNERYGSWLLLGEIVTDLELEPDRPGPDRCGACALCLEACPVGALTGARVLKADRCLSYWTTDRVGEVPPAAYGPLIRRWSFGCDICQEACPYNRGVPGTTDAELAPREQWQAFDWQAIKAQGRERALACYRGSPMERAIDRRLGQGD